MTRPRPNFRHAPRTRRTHLVALGVCAAAIHLGPLAIEIAGSRRAAPAAAWAEPAESGPAVPALVNSPAVRPHARHEADLG
jgi:hypothetical protein